MKDDFIFLTPEDAKYDSDKIEDLAEDLAEAQVQYMGFLLNNGRPDWVDSEVIRQAMQLTSELTGLYNQSAQRFADWYASHWDITQPKPWPATELHTPHTGPAACQLLIDYLDDLDNEAGKD